MKSSSIHTVPNIRPAHYATGRTSLILAFITCMFVPLTTAQGQEARSSADVRQDLINMTKPGAFGSDSGELLRAFARTMWEAAAAVPEYHPGKKQCWEDYARFVECIAAAHKDFECPIPEVIDCNATLPANARAGVTSDVKYAKIYRKAAARAAQTDPQSQACFASFAAYYDCRSSALGPSNPDECQTPGPDICPPLKAITAD